MADPSPNPRVFISAAEPSADLHAAALIRAVRQLHPAVEFCGVAGSQMRLAGCKGIYDMAKHSAMLSAAVRQLRHAFQMVSRAGREMAAGRYDLVVVIDAPTLNLQVARLAKSLNLPVLYYIAPQTWAWGEPLRIPLVRRRVDRMACILPFEEPYFRGHGIEADYVGHPLFARLTAHELDEAVVTELRADGGPILAIMPGSRRQEIKENFLNQLAVARALREEFPRLKILISVANPRVKLLIRQFVTTADFPVELHERENAELLRAADLALVVSGTITLEAAYHRTPTIVMYNTTRAYYQLARWIISTKYLSLPNILANREVVPEFMPYYTSPKPIIARAHALLSDAEARRQMSADLGTLVEPFIQTTASETTAKIVLDMIECRRQQTLAQPALQPPERPYLPRHVPAQRLPAPAQRNVPSQIS